MVVTKKYLIPNLILTMENKAAFKRRPKENSFKDIPESGQS